MLDKDFESFEVPPQSEDTVEDRPPSASGYFGGSAGGGSIAFTSLAASVPMSVPL